MRPAFLWRSPWEPARRPRIVAAGSAWGRFVYSTTTPPGSDRGVGIRGRGDPGAGPALPIAPGPGTRAGWVIAETGPLHYRRWAIPEGGGPEADARPIAGVPAKVPTPPTRVPLKGFSMKPADATAANAHRLLWAGFMAILASGVGFSIRAGILGQWADRFRFTQTELGAITGGGLTGFGIIILLS